MSANASCRRITRRCLAGFTLVELLVVIAPAEGAVRRIAEVSDGTSNSIMAAEKCLPRSRYGSDGGDNERGNNAGWDECVIRYHFPPLPDQDRRVMVTGTPSTPNDGSTNVWRRYFGSSHAGGVNAVFGDGSVRSVSFTVDPIVWMRACVIDDGAESGNIN